MKQFEVRMTMLVSVTVSVEAEDPEAAEKTAMEKTGRDEAYYLTHYNSVLEREVTEVQEQEPEQPEQLSFEKLTEQLQYFSPDAPATTLTIGDIREECRRFIRDSGWECLDDSFDEDSEAADYIQEHHPDWDTSGFSWSTVNYGALEFYCYDASYGDLVSAEMNISFYGDWKKQIGVFNVTD